MGLPSWLGGGKKTTKPGMIAAQGGLGGTPGMFGNPPPATPPLVAPPPAAPTNLLATTGGFAAVNAARRQRRIAASGSSSTTSRQAPAQTPTPRRLIDAGRAATGLY